MNAECYKFPMLHCVAKRFGPRRIPPRLKVENSPDRGEMLLFSCVKILSSTKRLYLYKKSKRDPGREVRWCQESRVNQICI